MYDFARLFSEFIEIRRKEMPKLKEAKKEATKYPLVSRCHSSLFPEKKNRTDIFLGRGDCESGYRVISNMTTAQIMVSGMKLSAQFSLRSPAASRHEYLVSLLLSSFQRRGHINCNFYSIFIR